MINSKSVKLDLSARLTFLFTSCLERVHQDLNATKTITMRCLGQLPPAELVGGLGWVQYQVQLLLQMEQLGNLRAGLDTSSNEVFHIGS